MTRLKLFINNNATELWWLAVFLFGIVVLSLSGCCSWAAGHCPKPPQVVTVEKRCELPALPDLPTVDLVPAGEACPLPMVCLTPANAKLLAVRESRMKIWIKEAKAACGAATQPASKP